jgi:hypothetical protein
LQVHISYLLARLLVEDMLFEVGYAGNYLESLPQALIVRFGHRIAAMAFLFHISVLAVECWSLNTIAAVFIALF